MDYQKARELLLHHLRYSGGVDLAKAHETHHDDAVLEFPQSGERFLGKANILGFRQVLWRPGPRRRRRSWRASGPAASFRAKTTSAASLATSRKHARTAWRNRRDRRCG